MTEQKHAKLSPSSAERWMTCPGSLEFCKDIPESPSGDAANEGTAAHSLGESCINNGWNAADCLGNEITVEGKIYTVTDRMVYAVQIYVDLVREIFGDGKGKVLATEQRSSCEWLHKGIYGTTDCCIVDTVAKVLHIIDYKNGTHEVDAVWNKQLLIYALGMLFKAQSNFPDLKILEVKIYIVQPNASHEEGPIRPFVISAEELMTWGLQVLKPAAVRAEMPGMPLVAGNHCHFCPGLASCPKHMEHTLAIAQTSFETFEVPTPDKLTPEQLCKVLDGSKLISKWVGAVEAYVQSQMEMGVVFPGYKLVAKRSNRKWINEQEAERLMLRVIEDETYTKKFVSVAQAEAAIKKRGWNAAEILNGLVEKPDAGVTIAPDTDKRQALPPPALVAFSDSLDFMQ